MKLYKSRNEWADSVDVKKANKSHLQNFFRRLGKFYTSPLYDEK